MAGPFTSPVAQSTPFEPNRNPQWGGNIGPSGLVSLETQSAIEEVFSKAISNDRFVLLASYGGNAITGRYLELFPNESSFSSPLYLQVAARLLSVTFQTSAASATAILSFFDLNVSDIVPIYSLSLVAGKRITANGMPLATFSPESLVAIRVTAGSINTPTLQFVFSAAAV